ncbi:MAG: DNA mismatch repair endonuclease MutL [Firmicutes bacterium]|nr:DNA mismatch repair endonuclease MutL [Bacillota bacterium]
MPKIKVLDESTACRIAAGEVVERPVSVVKELLENSLDAGADTVSTIISGSGVEAITVIDNGCGISQEDTPLAFHRHATSKISRASDLDSIATLGFRGEALPGIAAVSDLVIRTRVHESNQGFFMRVQGGRVLESGPAGCPVGTAVAIKDLFFNTPARRKHLKSNSTEMGLVAELVNKMALIRPEVRLIMEQRGKEMFRSPGKGKTLDALVAVYGVEAAGMMLPVSAAAGEMALEGYVSKPGFNRSTRQHITVAVNGRLVHSTVVNKALEEAYRGLISVGRYPLAVLHLRLSPAKIDVNVHPAKTEIKIEDEDRVADMIGRAVRGALREVNLIPGSGLAAGRRKDGPAAEPFRLAFAAPKAVLPRSRQPIAGGVAKAPGVGAVDPPEYDSRPVDPVESGGKEVPEAAQGVMSGPVGGKAGMDVAKAEPAVAENRHQYRAGLLTGLHIVGQLMDLYIICQGEDGLYIIDQHAAHERVLFERYYSLLLKGGPEVQYLITPQNISMRAHEKEVLREYRDHLQALGFVLEDFGRESLLLRGIPAGCTPGESRRLVADLVETILAQGKTDSSKVQFALAALLACKAAVKAGEKLSRQSMRELLEQLAQTGDPFTCPHGRPTVAAVSRRELNAMFKRV